MLCRLADVLTDSHEKLLAPSTVNVKLQNFNTRSKESFRTSHFVAEREKHNVFVTCNINERVFPAEENKLRQTCRRFTSWTRIGERSEPMGDASMMSDEIFKSRETLVRAEATSGENFKEASISSKLLGVKKNISACGHLSPAGEAQ